MKHSFLGLVALTLLFSSCKKKQNPFEISKQHIGLLTDSSQVKDLKTIFANDSLSTFINRDGFSGSKNSIDIFEKGGKKLLALTPKQTLDSTSVIQSIQIIDPRYKTDKDITTLSTFKDISSAYKVSRIDNLINSVIVNVKELHASFVIDKEELPANLRFDMNLKIETTHIPDQAKVKYFFIHWNHLNK
ncbi:hypothetical protein A8C32_16365 [Flavivirga aquatica]|uniref:Uncharacterized protein n=1 Tax=Flavivirga aquatica TaxID=1849968 RepID=A0A1E5T9H4_9FLAO|nr:hypothetical protein [Flavivirga aquatica]OEK08029.1 hypothetical protein A8C32_16365 [Flavivirga aquatica]